FGIVRGLTSLPLDVHLMIEHADHYVPRFIKAGANSITVHVEPEAKHDLASTLQRIRESGCRAGLTLNPETPFHLLEPYLDKIDILLIMTVHPGFGGQSFRADQMQKVRRAAKWNKSHERKIDIEVDGGINAHPPGSQLKTAQTSSSLARQFSTPKITQKRYVTCV